MKTLATMTAAAVVLGFGLASEVQAQEQLAAELMPGSDAVGSELNGSGFVGVSEIKGIANTFPDTNRWGVEVEGLQPETFYVLVRHALGSGDCSGVKIGDSFRTDPVGITLVVFDDPEGAAVGDIVDVCRPVALPDNQVLTGTLGPVPDTARSD